jgi:RHS repeat-associated protein
VGNVILTIDANGHQTQYFYTAMNRLRLVINAVGQAAQIIYDGAGNVVATIDARFNKTQFVLDDSYRVVQTIRADGTVTSQAYDTQGRVRSTTDPNGNQDTLADINLTGAANLVQNPGAEVIDPNSTGNAQAWTSVGVFGLRDDTVSHSGSASLSMLGVPNTADSAYFTQSYPGVQPGVRALATLWARPDGSSDAVTVQGAVLLRQIDATTTEAQTSAVTLATGSTAWQQVPLVRVDVPGYGQYTSFTADEIRLYASAASGSPNLWLDDMALYSVSVATTYDADGRVVGTLSPDGTRVRNVFDRFGRLAQTVDKRGKTTSLTYDSLNRPLSITDPLGNTVSKSYDALGNTASTTDPLTNETTMLYDSLSQLNTITYPDSTTEQFSYDPAGNPAGYTNNRSQSFTYTFYNNNRLETKTYDTDSSTVGYTWDAVGNCLTRVERNGDSFAFAYDAANRRIGVSLTPGGSSLTQAWLLSSAFDPNGNRVQLQVGTGSGAVYGTSTYGSPSVYGPASVFWSVPSGGYDSMNRLTAWQDALSNETTFSFDVNGRLTGMVFPNGSPNVTTTNSYDIMGRLLSSVTAMGMTGILSLAWTYDGSSNRLSTVTATDTYDYAVDDANRLVEEDINRLVELNSGRFRLGTPSGVDTTGDTVTLVALADSFSGTMLNGDRWRLAYVYEGYQVVGLEARQNDGLMFVFPRGYTNRIVFFDTSAVPVAPANSSVGNNGSLVCVAAENRVQLTGDFDVQVDFTDFQALPAGSANGALFLTLADTPAETLFNGSSPNNYVQVGIDATPEYASTICIGGSPTAGTPSATSDTSGSLRLTRSGDTVTAYYYDGTWQALQSASGFSTDAMWLSLAMTTTAVLCHGVYTDLATNLSASAFGTSGTYTSAVYDAGNSVTWDSITWEATVPAGAGVAFQIAVSSSSAGPFDFVGPDGTASTYFTTSGTAIYSGTTGRYAQYQATLTGDGTATPSLSRVDVLFGGSNTSQTTSYGYDGAGNMTSKVTEVYGSTTVTETRTVNNLNQITANSVVGATTVDWTYDWDDSGNMMSRSDGTNTTTYTWDEDNRLTLVTLPDTSTMAYTYDSMFRMLTRKLSTDANPTTFVWDGMNCIQETDPAGNVTRYYCPKGSLLSIDRTVSATTTTYQVHLDAIQSVRKVTDSSGTVVATYDFDAYGNALASTSDSVPNGGLQYRFVGGLGVRWDATTGLYYMRSRWYDPVLGRFMGRDPKRKANRYAYARSMPTRMIDPSGRDEADIANDPSFFEPGDDDDDSNEIVIKVHADLISPPAGGIWGCAVTQRKLAKALVKGHAQPNDPGDYNSCVLNCLKANYQPLVATAIAGAATVHLGIQSAQYRTAANLIGSDPSTTVTSLAADGEDTGKQIINSSEYYENWNAAEATYSAAGIAGIATIGLEVASLAVYEGCKSQCA